jgi:hypothetical protein
MSLAPLVILHRVNAQWLSSRRSDRAGSALVADLSQEIAAPRGALGPWQLTDTGRLQELRHADSRSLRGTAQRLGCTAPGRAAFSARGGLSKLTERTQLAAGFWPAPRPRP